jgi:alkanesulfonate monooxygenase SsuD/methylene tetrahydromethanopterin reductase-like flavin-dependent oxidoreductase (luciferase family)
VGLVILPTERWDRARRLWEWADRAGFSRAWTYDHIRWSGMPDGPWTAAVPLLAAAAGVTRNIRLGTLVATPNFRHPVTLAREAIALDDICGGRLDLGVGPGSEGPDATVLGQQPWTRRERLTRFAEFLEVLSPILDGEATTRTSLRTPYYEAREAPSTPGTAQRPLPLTVAAGGATGLGLAAAYGRHWVTIGPTGSVVRTPETVQEAAQAQALLLDQACVAAGRPPADIGRILLWTPTEPVIESADQFEEISAPFASLGFDEFVLHHPAQTGPYGGSVSAFEEIAARQRG